MADDKKTPETPAETPVVVEAGELVQPKAMKKPDRNSVNEIDAKIKAEISAIDAKMKSISDKIKAHQQEASKNGDASADTRARLKELKSKRDSLMKTRTELYAVRDADRESRDEKMKEIKDLKSQTKFKNVEAIDSQIKKLETQQSTTSMTLAKEKEVLKEIDELKKQRKVLAQHSAVSSALDGGKAAQQDSSTTIKDINEQLGVIKAEMDKLHDELGKNDKSKDQEYPKLMKEKDALKDQRQAKQAENQKLWDDFKVATSAWRANQDEWDAYKKARFVKDKAEVETRKAEAMKRREEELAKKTPYEEEMDLCDYLANYLATTYLNEKKDEEAAPAAAPVLSEFEGLQLSSSKKRDGDFYIAPKESKKGPKKGGEGPKTKVAGTKKGKIILHTDTLESFGLLKMEPPTSVEQVEAVVAALNAKKAEFKVMPRGQIVSIAELNHKFEVEAEVRAPRSDRPERDVPKKFEAKAPAAKKPTGGGPTGGKKIDVTSAELFPALGAPKAAPAAAAAKE